ncbi:hypothetical protein ACQV2C_07765 [Pantoea allii]|uniref:hypothetical protein n=1 Tax=Pantoea allii TaxID=574096 RepID=UPI003D319252
MSSPTITALDYILIMLGIAPLKYLLPWWLNRRAKKREKALDAVMADRKAAREKLIRKFNDNDIP